MEYQVSARKYRPATFEDVVGQGHVVQTLVNAITAKRIAHAFLFSGTRGVGKTTVARILAKALNCEHGSSGTPCNRCPSCVEIMQGTSIDVIEIDGASNTSVDDVREVRENVKFAPFRGRYRVYIIDEVHMLSNSAFNALLKTLEEPPAHVVFVFATTEMHKIPPTILSRCQHHNFRRIPRSEIIQRLHHVAEQEGVTVEDRSLVALARASGGSLRDALSLLDQAVAFSGKVVGHTDLETLLGSVPLEHVQAMISAVVTQDSPAGIRVIADLLEQGHDLRAFCSEVVEHVRNLLVAAVVPSRRDLRGLIEVSEDELGAIACTAKGFTPEQLQELFRIFSQAEDGLRVSATPRFLLEVAAVRATRLLSRESVGSESSTKPAPRLESPQVAGVAVQDQSRSPVSSHSQAQASEGAQGPQGSLGKPPVPVPPGPGAPSSPVQAEPAMPVMATHAVRGTPSLEMTASTGTAEAVGHQEVTSSTAPSTEAGESVQVEQQHPPVDLKWEHVQEQIAVAHPNIGPFLDRGTLVNVEEGQVTIGYSKVDSVARAVVEKADHLRILADLCQKMTGRPFRVHVVELAGDPPVGRPRARTRADRVHPEKLALLERTRSHPVVKQVLDIFGGEVVEVRQGSRQREGPE